MTEEKLRRPDEVPPEERQEICARKLYVYDRLPKRVREELANAAWGMNDKLLFELNVMLDQGWPQDAMVQRVRAFTANVGEKFYAKKMYPRPPMKGETNGSRADAYRPRQLPEEGDEERAPEDHAAGGDRGADSRP